MYNGIFRSRRNVCRIDDKTHQPLTRDSLKKNERAI